MKINTKVNLILLFFFIMLGLSFTGGWVFGYTVGWGEGYIYYRENM